MKLAFFRILSLSLPQTVVEKKEVAKFICKVDANPFTEKTVQWSLPDHPRGNRGWENKKEVKVNLEEGTSTLLLHYPNRYDRGRVVCSATNGVKNMVVEDSSRLTINREFNEIIKSPLKSHPLIK